MQMMDKKWTYKKAGVDREESKKAISRVWELISQTFEFRSGKIGQPLNLKGHYAGLIDIGGERHIALHVDNVGTKVLVAQRMKKFDTVGIDLVAMHANDLLSIGAEPVALTDYLALKEPDEKRVEEIMKGIVKGARKSSMVVIGGESATVPEIVSGVDNSAFDLSGMSMGLVKSDEIIQGQAVKEGDHIYGLESSGIHSNGLTLARRLLFDVEGLSVNDTIPGTNLRVGNQLLTPTRIYVPEVMEMLAECETIHGIGHITGGAFSKLHRLRPDGLQFELSMPKPPLLFRKLQEIGNIETEELYNTYNMGIGLVIIASTDEEDKIKKISKKHGVKCQTIGQVAKGDKIQLETWDGQNFNV